MKVYVTGAMNWQKLEELAYQLRQLGHTTVIPGDVVDNDHTEDQAIIARLHALLDCDQVVTTAPTDGDWGEATHIELNVARTARKPVVPASRALEVHT